MKISAIIPAYNAAPWIGRAIRSVLQQTTPVAEIIVVDDESTDDTAEVVAASGERVRYIRQTNGGPAKARNTAIEAASGDWLALLDADDWWEPRHIELQLAALRQSPQAILVYTALRMVSDDGESTIRECFPADKLWPALRYSCPIAPSSVLLRATAIRQIGGFSERHRGNEDWEAWVRLRRIGPFAGVAEPVTGYRVAPTSLSGNGGHMFRDFLPMLDATLVGDLRGVRRAIWRRRILALHSFSTALWAREAGLSGEEGRLLRYSFQQWPSPFWYPRRYKVAAVTMRSAISRRWAAVRPAKRLAEPQ